ncbi:hypothetical protein PG996_012325 [Apiospora saccharicola]|uniref:Uncharacterized protein n=1 Tax=Apiospora saccharicola TaxID=335842 RepID=A0ABR1U288_9PEZI
MSGNNNNNNNTPKPSGSPPFGAPTEPRAMREQAARAAGGGRGRIRVALPIVPPPGQPPNQYPFGENNDDGRSGSAVVFGVAEGSDTRVRHPNAEAYPPPQVQQQGPPRVGGHIRPPPGLFQPPSGPAYQPRADANMGRRVSSDGAVYPPPQQDNRRVSRGFNPERMHHRGPAEGRFFSRCPPDYSGWLPGYSGAPRSTEPQTKLSSRWLTRVLQQTVAHDHVIASRRRSQEIIAQRAAEEQRLRQEQQELQELQARFVEHQRGLEAQKAAREQAARVEKAREQFEKGRDFEDDDDFYPGHRRNGGSI